MRIRAIGIGIGVVGTLALLAGLHHIVVVTARGTAFSNAFAGSCHWCHGDAYEGFGTGVGAEAPSTEREALGAPAPPGPAARR